MVSPLFPMFVGKQKLSVSEGNTEGNSVREMLSDFFLKNKK